MSMSVQSQTKGFRRIISSHSLIFLPQTSTAAATAKGELAKAKPKLAKQKGELKAKPKLAKRKGKLQKWKGQAKGSMSKMSLRELRRRILNVGPLTAAKALGA